MLDGSSCRFRANHRNAKRVNIMFGNLVCWALKKAEVCLRVVQNSRSIVPIWRREINGNFRPDSNNMMAGYEPDMDYKTAGTLRLMTDFQRVGTIKA